MAGTPSISGAYYLPQFLPNFIISYMQEAMEFAADRVFPRIPVTKRSGDYMKWDKYEDFRADTLGARRPGTRSSSVDILKSNGTYQCQQYAKRVELPDEILNDAAGIVAVQTQYAEELAQQMLKMREVRAANIATAQSNYASGNKAAAGAYWDDYLSGASTSHPFIDITNGIRAIKLATGVRCNKILIPDDTALILRQHPDFVARYSAWTGTVEGGFDLPPKILGMDVVVPGSFATSSNRRDDGTGTLSAIWGANCVMYYEKPGGNMGLHSLCTFKTFDYTVEKKSISRYDQDIWSTIMESMETLQEAQVAADTGYLLYNCHS